MTKTNTEMMKKIRDDILDLKESPLYEYRVKNHYFPVLGEGNHNADIVFIGEAPGEKEALTGRPFCGPAGRILDELLEGIGLDRQDVYISNVVKDRPPNNRDPLPAEIELYSPFLYRQLEVLKPKVIAALGRFSTKYILEKFGLPEATQTITQLHGKVIDVKVPWGKAKIIPLYHPAVALYSGGSKKVLVEDFKVIAKFGKKG
ncbi:MAG: uracil-DNA glycosylase [Candidatus Curtissbacteria bacterium]|nr:uracil-DNA glycosylase [Candidatus Curtissbacteria bacterium]